MNRFEMLESLIKGPLHVNDVTSRDDMIYLLKCGYAEIAETDGGIYYLLSPQGAKVAYNLGLYE